MAREGAVEDRAKPQRTPCAVADRPRYSAHGFGLQPDAWNITPPWSHIAAPEPGPCDGVHRTLVAEPFVGRRNYRPERTESTCIAMTQRRSCRTHALNRRRPVRANFMPCRATSRSSL